MDFAVIWTERAAKDLAQLVARIALDKPKAADKFRIAVLTTVERIGLLPQLGGIYEQSPELGVREFTFPPYRIFYRVIDTNRTVEILTIWHGSRMEPELEAN